jgi:hypothetical protein
MNSRTEIRSTRVAPAIIEMIKCELVLSDATKPKQKRGAGLKKTATSTTTI